MNYYEAKQRQTDKRWDYTRNNRPTGYCCEYLPVVSEIIPIGEAESKEYQEAKEHQDQEAKEYSDTAHKHHTGGHETEKEACECYKEYRLDHHLSLNRTMSSQQKCRICGEWTQKFAEVNLSCIFTLCDKHNNRETVEGLYNAPSWSASSD